MADVKPIDPLDYANATARLYGADACILILVENEAPTVYVNKVDRSLVRGIAVRLIEMAYEVDKEDGIASEIEIS